MTDVNMTQATVVASFAIANAAAIVGAYVSMRVEIAILKEKVTYISERIKYFNEKQSEEKKQNG